MDWLNANEISVTRIAHSGALELSAIIVGFRKARTYYGYSRRAAIRAFLNEMTGERISYVSAAPYRIP